MRVADLFSGIGGFTVALDVFEDVETVTYCDIDGRSQAILKKHVDQGTLPKAPIHNDVSTLHLAPGSVDMIVGGFPCTGFSWVGFREGIQNKGSSLVNQVFRLVQEASPKFVLMENVTAITLFPEYRDICTAFSELGYRVTWTCVKACDVGAPTKRYRWFALCSRQDVDPGSLTLRLKGDNNKLPLHRWIDTEPERTVPTIPWKSKDRLFLLGNTVVPSAVRVAFVMLFTGLSIDVDTLLDMREYTFQIPSATAVISKDDVVASKTGVWDDGFCSVVPPAMTTRLYRSLNLVLDPGSWVTDKPRMHSSAHQTPSPLISHRVNLPLWATPRCQMGCSNYLSRRTKTDLRTQIRFEQNTRDKAGYISPEFVEWLQGYPQGWTAFQVEE